MFFAGLWLPRAIMPAGRVPDLAFDPFCSFCPAPDGIAVQINVEDRAYTEHLVPQGAPDPPRNPDPPR
jgi:hypothetical protein